MPNRLLSVEGYKIILKENAVGQIKQKNEKYMFVLKFSTFEQK